MKKTITLIIVLSLIGGTAILNSCKKKVEGCTDPNSINYNPKANENDGSCIAKVCGCTDPTATNYNPAANTNNGSCQYSTATTGQCIFWSAITGNWGGSINIYVNSVYIGAITASTGSTPICGTAGFITITEPEGVYNYNATASGGYMRTGTVTIFNGNCSNMQLQ